LINPETANANNTKPIWYVGDNNGNAQNTYSNGGGSAFPTGYNANFQTNPATGRQDYVLPQFTGAPPVSGTNRNGNVKLTTHVFPNANANLNPWYGTTTIYAAITNPATQGVLESQRSTTGGQTWAAAGAPAVNYMA